MHGSAIPFAKHPISLTKGVMVGVVNGKGVQAEPETFQMAIKGCSIRCPVHSRIHTTGCTHITHVTAPKKISQQEMVAMISM